MRQYFIAICYRLSPIFYPNSIIKEYGPLTISLSVLFNSRSHLKSIFSLFIALLRHWGPHATSINNKIFRHLIN